jgi:hypothetical protein
MVQEGGGRYFIAPRDAPLENILFTPYWRFKGMVFSSDEQGLVQRLVDSNLLALHSTAFPFSLGIRPQVLRLKPITPGIGGRFLDPEFQFQGFHSNHRDPHRFRGNFDHDRAPLFKAFIGEMLSLIYAPFYVKDERLFDGVLDCPTGQLVQERLEDLPYSQNLDNNTRFLPMLCPTCGWDLEGEKNALVLLCRNCDSACQASGATFHKVDFGFMPGTDDASLYLPFWRIQARISELALNSYADLVRFANLPRAIQSSWEKGPTAFWVPAFKIQPLLFLRLARIFTAAQLPCEPPGIIPPSAQHPVSLPVSEAAESVRVLLVSMATRKESVFAKLSGASIGHEEYSLVYVPFILRGAELIHPVMQVSISANAVNWGKFL